MNHVFQCPKCHSTMRTYNRNGVHIEQCDSCRGIFLDYGELETLIQWEGRMMQQMAPPPHQPAWGTPPAHHGHYRPGSFWKLLFSS